MEQEWGKNCRMQKNILQKTQPFEVAAEFVLPDYRGEISKLLWVRPVFAPPTNYFSGGKAEISGAVRYEVLYVDPEGALCGAELEDGYSFSLPIDAQGREVTLAAELCAEAVVGRVIAPRKLSVKCRMNAKVSAYAWFDFTPEIVGQATADFERISDMGEFGVFCGTCTGVIELSGELQPERTGEARVVLSHGEVLLDEVSAVRDEVCCRGSAEITLLLADEQRQGAPIAQTLTLPFEENIPMDGVSFEHHVSAVGTVNEITTRVEETGITLAARIWLCVKAQTSEPIVLCRDLFVPGMKATCHFSEQTPSVARSCENRHFSVSAEAARDALELSPDAAIADGFCTARIKETERDGRNTTFIGEILCRMLVAQGGEYVAKEWRVPWKSRGEDVGELGAVSVCVPRLSLRADATRVFLRAELSLATCTQDATQARMLERVELVQGEPVARGDIEICYPAKGESLFELGKRYGIPPARIALENGIFAEDPTIEAAAQRPCLVIPAEQV